MKNTILIADDHTLVRETWSIILNSQENLEVIGECGNGIDAVEKATDLKPDIVLMDINLPGINGIEATEKISKSSPASKVLAVSLYTQPGYARKMMQKGAKGYVTKSSSREELLRAIQTILQGGSYICTEIKNNLSDQLLNGDEQQDPYNSLSTRELGVIALIKKGFSSKEMAQMLSISIKTVEVHRYNILKKLNLKNSSALVNFINTKYPVLES